MASRQTTPMTPAPGKPPYALFGFWAVLRLVTHPWAALISNLRPLTPTEQMIPLWPPTAPLTSWLTRVWLAPWQRWDTIYYLWIATRGYAVDDGTAQFHPLYPWLAVPLVRMGLHPLLALLTVNSIAVILLIWVVYRLARLELAPSTARTGVLLMLCSPLAFALFIPYAEAVFLLFAVLCLYHGRRKQWWIAGGAGALAALTRQQGLFLALPLAWELWESAGRRWRTALAGWRDWLALALIPAGYFAWIVYRAWAFNDLAVDFTNLHTLIYSVLIAPSAVEVVPVQTFMWPWQALYLAVAQLWRAPDVDLIVNLVGGGYFLLLVAWAWRRLRVSDRWYVGVITLVSFGYQTGSTHPYMGLLRHLFLAFPVFLALAPRAEKPSRKLWWIITGLLGLFFLLLLYGLEAWIP